MMHFKAYLKIIGINPFVFVPEEILHKIFITAERNKGPLPVKGLVNGALYRQTLVRFKGQWRLYINTTMLKDSPKRIGELLELEIDYDPDSRQIEMPLLFKQALEQNSKAKDVFIGLPASRSKEIVRYLANLKTQQSLERNVEKAIDFLLGNTRFVGRDKPYAFMHKFRRIV